MKKKWIYFVLLLLLVLASVGRIYQVNSQAIILKDNVHRINEPFVLGDTTMTLTKVSKLSKEETIEIEKQMDKSELLEGQAFVYIAVDLRFEKPLSEKRDIFLEEFELKKDIYLALTILDTTYKHSDTEYTLYFQVPEKYAAKKSSYYIAPSLKLNKNNERDLMEFEVE